MSDNKEQCRLTEDELRRMLRKAFNFGQTYWQQADSEYISQQDKSSKTMDTYCNFVNECCAILAAKEQENG